MRSLNSQNIYFSVYVIGSNGLIVSFYGTMGKILSTFWQKNKLAGLEPVSYIIIWSERISGSENWLRQ